MSDSFYFGFFGILLGISLVLLMAIVVVVTEESVRKDIMTSGHVIIDNELYSCRKGG